MKLIDSDYEHRCDYCGEVIPKEQDKIVQGTPAEISIFHQQCYATAKAERVQEYEEVLRSYAALKPRETL